MTWEIYVQLERQYLDAKLVRDQIVTANNRIRHFKEKSNADKIVYWTERRDKALKEFAAL